MRITSIRLRSAADDLTVGNVKGDVDKTTLGVNIAIDRALAGRVLLVAGDEKSTAAFTDSRAGALGTTKLHRGQRMQFEVLDFDRARMAFHGR